MTYHPYQDPTVDKTDAPILSSANPFKLAVFSVNIGQGLVMSDAEELAKGTWEESVRLARTAERLGFEAMVPLARWRGHGGRTNPHHRSLETFTWAAGLSALTQHIQVFATFHVPTVHPVMAAKMAATVDHISGGRFGLNIVAGWQPDELRMFGADKHDHDERYGVADEWTRLVKRLWTEEGDFDFEGAHFTAPGAFSEPKPIQRPGPPIMSAGISPAGRDFAARHADLIFAAIENAAKTADTVRDIKEMARERYGRELKVFGVGHVTCADTEEQARADYQRVIIDRGDWDAARATIEKLMQHSQTVDYASSETRRLMEGVIRAFFAHPLTGTPEQVVAGMREMADAGLDGMALTWNDYDEGLRQYEEALLPLLVEAGLRVPVPAATPARA
jgi:alkanesulfonate monooxygenase SsuD/methylene tetrahydromethanopterin reductase-like flavin-dependent oxidoreductase (luciferase family)